MNVSTAQAHRTRPSKGFLAMTSDTNQSACPVADRSTSLSSGEPPVARLDFLDIRVGNTAQGKSDSVPLFNAFKVER